MVRTPFVTSAEPWPKTMPEQVALMRDAAGALSTTPHLGVPWVQILQALDALLRTHAARRSGRYQAPTVDRSDGASPTDYLTSSRSAPDRSPRNEGMVQA